MATFALATGTMSASESDSPLIQQATLFINRLAQGDYTSAASTFDSTMSAAMPADKLKETWESILGQAGSFDSIESTSLTTQGGYDVIVVTTKFENMRLDTKVVFDKSGKIAGLWFAPAAPRVGYSPPAYSDSSKFHEFEVKVGSGEYALPGTVTMPNGSGPFPGIILVHGSGPNDRDETIGPNKPFKDIAWGLASRGIAVLRYEKRTRAFPQQFVENKEKFTVKQETIDDAAAAVKLLDTTNGIDHKQIFVLGHSLGGMLIPRIAEVTPKAAGYVVMAGAARPLGEVVVEQVRYIDSLKGPLTDKELADLDSLKAQVKLTESPKLTLSTPASELPMGINAAYWLDLRGYKPAEVATKIKKPLLVLQGGRDYQVPIKDFDLWKKALGSESNATFKLYPDLNHLFISGTGPSVPSEYDQPGHVSRQVIEDMAAWINRN
jgi:hypothetical protein